MSLKSLKEQINSRLPKVEPKHTDQGHFYYLASTPGYTGIQLPTPLEQESYPSVTAKLQILKDEGLVNWKMNKAIEYVFANFKIFSDDNIIEHLEAAKMVSVEIFEDAGDVGTEVHGIRERYFADWIASGTRPKDGLLSYIPKELPKDLRIVSVLRAIEKFLDDTGYIPVACEIFLVDPKLKVGGTMDDIGIMPVRVRQGNIELCKHNKIEDLEKLKINCVECGARWDYQLVFSDLKTSNQVKYHYFFQLAMYYSMFVKWVKIRPKRNFILKVSKEDGTYKIVNVPAIHKLVPYTRAILKVNEAIEVAKKLLKPETTKI